MPDINETILTDFSSSVIGNETEYVGNELEQRKNEINLLREMNARFVKQMAHDLKNPLAVVLSFSEFLTDEGDDSLTVRQRDFVERIHNSAVFMSNLISDLSDLTHTDKREFCWNEAVLNITDLVKESVDYCGLSAAQKEIKINVESGQNIIKVFADKEKIKRVFNVLLSNAIKYSFKNSEVRLRINKENHNVFISFTDKGIGIAPEHHEKIFLPFEKAARKGTNGEKGTGLGLAIASRIVDAHQGRIYLESEPGKGASFIVMLPVCTTDYDSCNLLK
jgi:two-component system, sensor histidine kinase and response regulator